MRAQKIFKLTSIYGGWIRWLEKCEFFPRNSKNCKLKSERSLLLSNDRNNHKTSNWRSLLLIVINLTSLPYLAKLIIKLQRMRFFISVSSFLFYLRVFFVLFGLDYLPYSYYIPNIHITLSQFAFKKRIV